MSENMTIARPYATAVFEQARDTGQAPAWSDTLALLSLLTSDPDMRQLISNPKVSRRQLQELVFEICGEALSAAARNLVKTLIQAERLQYTPYIKELYEQMRANAGGKVDVEVVAAYELDQRQQDDIARAIAERSGKRVDVTTSVDESLIGGVVIRVGDSVIDASLRGRLTELRNQLA